MSALSVVAPIQARAVQNYDDALNAQTVVLKAEDRKGLGLLGLHIPAVVDGDACEALLDVLEKLSAKSHIKKSVEFFTKVGLLCGVVKRQAIQMPALLAILQETFKCLTCNTVFHEHHVERQLLDCSFTLRGSRRELQTDDVHLSAVVAQLCEPHSRPVDK